MNSGKSALNILVYPGPASSRSVAITGALLRILGESTYITLPLLLLPCLLLSHCSYLRCSTRSRSHLCHSLYFVSVLLSFRLIG